jgi:hypothetical protein
MKPDPIQELWVTKDRLAREAGYDTDRFVENLRQWEKAHPQSGRVINNAQELRQLVTEEETKRAAASALALNETPPRKNQSD